ncbi:MAG: alanine racemase [Spirochaetota bacterium]
MRATRAIIHLEHLRRNLRLLRGRIGAGVKICLAVKADAYGHGAVQVSKTALSEGVEFLAVATVSEAIELRNAGIQTPVLLLTPPIPEEIGEIPVYNITPVVAERELITMLAEIGRKRGKQVTVHLKIDTGMGRIGCRPEEAPHLLQLITETPSLKLGGICTHFPVADSADNRATLRQLQQFKDTISNICQKGLPRGIIHAANSGAIIGTAEAYFDMVRPGILMYGYYPSKEQTRIIEVKPLMELETVVVFLKRVPEDTPISYGMTYRTKRETVIATLPVGYGDGYNRLLSNRGKVSINNRFFPIVGRVCMDQCMVDLGPDSNVRMYDRVVLFGPDTEGLSAEHIADLIGTIPYEVTCSINKRVPRIYSDGI